MAQHRHQIWPHFLGTPHNPHLASRIGNTPLSHSSGNDIIHGYPQTEQNCYSHTPSWINNSLRSQTTLTPFLSSILIILPDGVNASSPSFPIARRTCAQIIVLTHSQRDSVLWCISQAYIRTHYCCSRTPWYHACTPQRFRDHSSSILVSFTKVLLFRTQTAYLALIRTQISS